MRSGQRLRIVVLGSALIACSDSTSDPAFEPPGIWEGGLDAQTATDGSLMPISTDAEPMQARDAGESMLSDAAAPHLDAGAGAGADADAALDASMRLDAGQIADAGAAPAVDAAQTVDSSVVHDAGAQLPGWKLVWSDEFDGDEGALLDPARWVYETGGNGWGNDQLEFDTDRADNASLDGHGELVITARKEAYMGKMYTSARLKTQGKFEHRYGRYEARIKIPFGQGMWPAFWMLGTDIDSAGWPSCGEIDVMENIGREPSIAHGTFHGPGYSGADGIGAPYTLQGSAALADDYHVFAVEWEPNKIRWYVDGKLYQTRTPADLPSGSRWVFDHSFFILLNLAVGGGWPGNPDQTTVFPQTMRVDYVRVYDRAP